MMAVGGGRRYAYFHGSRWPSSSGSRWLAGVPRSCFRRSWGRRLVPTMGTSGAPAARPTGTRPGFSDLSAASVRSNESETISDRAQLLALTAATCGRDVATKHAVSALGRDGPAAVPPYVQEATLPAPGTHPSCATGASTSTGSQRPRQGAGHRWYRGPERR
jgi:hypothetical protein